ncbi:hypothetical protein [Peribacillus deserti]|uniref:Uncharacterized protein n=1 Tax=Peribacillus deserti TaxID=673318 RepID=A0A2N5M089_9BACI|nr:hypothetical protein [Peribacillus deserti]PLT27761.1 hypothetical protein CUU66_22115 [Peribacillus deserti]
MVYIIEKQTSGRHKKSGSERPILPFDGDWLMTEEVSSQLDATRIRFKWFRTAAKSTNGTLQKDKES